MIYKFEEEHNHEKTMEVMQSSYTGGKIKIEITGYYTEGIVLNKDQLYNLIGALHSLQTKIKSI